MKTTWLTALLVLLACGGSDADTARESRARHESLDASGEPLRAAFNAAEGKVRAVLLASPT